MKKNIIFKGLAAVALAGTMVSCSEDYLDVPPVTDVSREQLMSSVVGAEQALEGAINMMCMQYGAADFQQNNSGEAFCAMAYGEALGQDYINGLWSGNANYNWDWALGNSNALVSSIPWRYYYGLIGAANNIIGGMNLEEIDGLSETDVNRLKFVKGSALTLRAYSYFKLMQLFAQRWEDSNNGENYCIVLRLEDTPDEVNFCKGIDVYNKMYSDLDEAILLFEESGAERANKWSVNIDVARGVYARVAMLRHDWKVAEDMAAAARKGYTIMSNDEYMSGFCNDCSGFIWHQYPMYDTTYYWSWGAWQACNGAYIFNFNACSGGAMDIDLYNKMDQNDIRRNLYLMPDKLAWVKKSQNKGGITEADFWDASMVGETKALNLAMTDIYVKGDPVARGMYNVATFVCMEYMENHFKGNLAAFTDDSREMSYVTLKSSPKNTKRDLLVKKGTYAELAAVQLGAQFKFWANKPYGNMAFPWMRAAEMALTEAEAAAMQPGGETRARKALEEVQKLRVPGYSCTSTGQALIDEIRIARRIELWGEGHAWFDLKRWNLPMERRAWEDGNPASGNWAKALLGEGQKMAKKLPTDNAGWVMSIPNAELQYNSALDVSLLPGRNDKDAQ